jgi:hypothetical protein
LSHQGECYISHFPRPPKPIAHHLLSLDLRYTHNQNYLHYHVVI